MGEMETKGKRENEREREKDQAQREGRREEQEGTRELTRRRKHRKDSLKRECLLFSETGGEHSKKVAEKTMKL